MLEAAFMPFNAPIPDPTPRPKKSSALSSLVEAEKMMQIAVLLPVSAFVGWGIGAWLDKVFNQSWLALAGILFGGFAGLLYVIRLVIGSGSKPKSGAGPSAPKS
jgi:ATP synthase protein I